MNKIEKYFNKIVLLLTQIVTGELHFYQLLAFLKENLRFPLFDCDTPCIRLISGGVAISGNKWQRAPLPIWPCRSVITIVAHHVILRVTFKVILYHSVSLLHKQKHTNAQTQHRNAQIKTRK